MSTGAFLKIFDFQTPADKEGKLLYEAAITTKPTTIGRKEMGLPSDDNAVSSKAMQCHVDPYGNIVVRGGLNVGTPWCVHPFQFDVVPHQTVYPDSELKLIQHLMKKMPEGEKLIKYAGRRLEYIFTNKNKAQLPQTVKQIEDIQQAMMDHISAINTQQVQFESTQKNILEDIAELKKTAEEFKKLDAFSKDNLFKRLNTLSDKVEQLEEENNTLENIQKIDLMMENIKQDLKDLNTLCKDDFSKKNNALRARVEQLEEQNNKLQKSQDDILAIVKTLQEQNETLVQMMQVKEAPAPAEPDKGDTFDSIPAIKTPVTEDSGVSHSASDEVIDETEDEDDEPAPQTLQTLQNDKNEDDETQPDDDDFGPQTQVYEKNGLQTLENDQPEDPEKDSNADNVMQTLDFYNPAPESEQEIHENQLAYVDPMDNQTLIANQTMEPVDDDEVVMKPPKKVTDDEMKEIVDIVIHKYLNDESPDYATESTNSLLAVVKSKLNEDNIGFNVKADNLIQKIRDAFNAWAENHINKEHRMDDSVPKSEPENYINKKRPMDDSVPKSEQADAKKPKYDTNQQMEDADSVFKPAQITFLKKLDKKVKQSPMSMIRNDPKKKDLLASWAYDASLSLFNETGKNPHMNTVYAYIMDNYWEDAKNNPDLDLASYEVKADKWNTMYESERAQKKKK
jgi:hypothetical protein